MKYFENYSNSKSSKYKIIALGDTSPIQKNQELNETLLFKNNDFVNSVNNGEWEGKPIDLNHEATQRRDFTKYGYIRKAFVNDTGFVDIQGNEVPASTNENKTIYSIVELTQEGEEFFKNHQHELSGTSSYFTYKDDDGAEADKHGDHDKQVVVIQGIKPVSLSILTNQEPKIKINDKYIINCEKNIDNNFSDNVNDDSLNMAEDKKEIENADRVLVITPEDLAKVREAMSILQGVYSRAQIIQKNEDVEDKKEENKKSKCEDIEDKKEENKKSKNEDTEDENKNCKNEEEEEKKEENKKSSKNEDAPAIYKEDDKNVNEAKQKCSEEEEKKEEENEDEEEDKKENNKGQKNCEKRACVIVNGLKMF